MVVIGWLVFRKCFLLFLCFLLRLSSYKAIVQYLDVLRCAVVGISRLNAKVLCEFHCIIPHYNIFKLVMVSQSNLDFVLVAQNVLYGHFVEESHKDVSVLLVQGFHIRRRCHKQISVGYYRQAANLVDFLLAEYR